MYAELDARIYVTKAKVQDFSGTLKPGKSAKARHAFAVPKKSRETVTVAEFAEALSRVLAGFALGEWRRALIVSADIASASDLLNGNVIGNKIANAFRALDRAREGAVRAGAASDSTAV